LKLQKVAVVSKVGSKDSEEAARAIAKKFLAKKSTVYTIAPIEVEGAKKVEALDELKKEKLDLVVTLGGDGTTLRVFRYLENETPILTINVGGNRGILSEITIEEIDDAINKILKDEFFLDKRTRVVASCEGKEFPPALNEIYICRTNLTKTAEIEIKFQNDTVKQKMDGVIIATPLLAWAFSERGDREMATMMLSEAPERLRGSFPAETDAALYRWAKAKAIEWELEPEAWR
jgi:NAD+ kinase